MQGSEVRYSVRACGTRALLRAVLGSCWLAQSTVRYCYQAYGTHFCAASCARQLVTCREARLGIVLGRAVRMPCCELCSAAANLQRARLGIVIRRAVRMPCCELCSAAANLQKARLGMVIRRAVRMPCCELCLAAANLQRAMLGIVIRRPVRVPCCELCSAAANLQGSEVRYSGRACSTRALL